MTRHPGYFITGTDTAVGKTIATASLLHAFRQRGWRVAPMKPVAAGAIAVNGEWVNEDVALLRAVAEDGNAMNIVGSDLNPCLFRAALAPHLAAAAEGREVAYAPITEAFTRLRARFDLLLVEGAGGFLVPLSGNRSMADLPGLLGLEVILVVAMRLGCLNHALLTAEAIRARGLVLAGWIANETGPTPMPAQAENLATLANLLAAPKIGHLPWLESNASDPQAWIDTAAAALYPDRLVVRSD